MVNAEVSLAVSALMLVVSDSCNGLKSQGELCISLSSFEYRNELSETDKTTADNGGKEVVGAAPLCVSDAKEKVTLQEDSGSG